MSATNIFARFERFFQDDKQLFLLGLGVVILYLSPLFGAPLYISIFDNLDSTVPLLKILAHSGKIFADNNDIIPNMMNGLPRSTYGSEYNVMLWLYYFFTPKTAYIINQTILHIVAYVSMYVFLDRHFHSKYEINLSIIGALYFALIPFFSPEGLSIPLLPLVTYVLLNILEGRSSIWDWIFLAAMPLYTSFVFIYMFYIILGGFFFLFYSIKNRKVPWRFLVALVIMGIAFLLKEYRLLLSMFVEKSFISQRTDFNIFFSYDTLEAFRKGHTFFLIGHPQHLVDLQDKYILPVIFVGMLLSFSKRKFSYQESMIVWLIMLVSIITDFWNLVLTQLYSMPLLVIFSLIVWLLTKFTRLLPSLLLIQFLFAFFTFIMFCQCGHGIVNIFPILKMLNITRIAFVQPLIWAILLVLSLRIYFIRLHYTTWFVVLLITAQIFLAFSAREYAAHPVGGYATFENYFAPDTFNDIKKHFPKPIKKHRVISYGLEPAVSLYNGFYTVDGYTTNYPRAYKNKFRRIIQNYLGRLKKDNQFDRWGSKAYLMSIFNTPDGYKRARGNVIEKPSFDTQAMCSLQTEYLISSYEISQHERTDIVLITKYKGGKDSWDIYLYELNCTKEEKDNQ